jgi:hypothetical protein
METLVVVLPPPVVVALVALPAPIIVALVALPPTSTVTPCALAKCGVLRAIDDATLNESSISAKVAGTALLLFFDCIRN